MATQSSPRRRGSMRNKLIVAAMIAGTCTPAIAQADRTVLPAPTPPFNGTIVANALDSKPAPVHPVQAPAGAPNVFLFMSDDVGFAMSSAFGGPVPTPNMEKLAKAGQRYNRFHTTGICSPSRAALLTGRNHHNAGVGWLSDISTGYPGYGGRILPETATIAQVLHLNGYNTGMFGKHHNIPAEDRSAAGPYDSWPTGLGFEYFYGFPYGDVDQFSPTMYRGISRVDPDERKGKMVDQRLADDVISWVHNQKAGAPDKPFFAYLAPGSAHAPHQAPPEWIARFKGKYDMGWDKIREDILRRQIAQGIVPKGTKLTARPEGIPAWDSLTPEQKAFASRTMEVAAAQLAFQDAQLGRIIDELDRMGIRDNTFIAIINGDNGASGEAGPRGTINELRSMGRHDEREEWMHANFDNLGGPMTYQNYPVGWAWAMNTPLRWTKQFASMLGGVRNDMIVSWTGHVAKPGSVCGQFSHLIDLAPTILEAANLPAPKVVNGIQQKPMDGQSLLPSLAACQGDKPRTQYFEIGGKVGLYSDGWFLSGEDDRPSWENVGPGGPRPPVTWTLYDLTKDWAQATDVAAKNPQKMAEMKALWDQEAKRNNVYPQDYRFGPGRADIRSFMSAAKHYDLWGKDVSLPAMGKPLLFGRAFTLVADLKLDSAQASGAVVALGSRFGGWSLYLDKGRPAFTFARSTDPQEISSVVSTKTLPAGASKLTMRFASRGFMKDADVILSADGTEFARVNLPSSVLMPAGNGETLDVGKDIGVPVVEYATPHGMIEGDITHVSIDYD